MRIIKNIFIAVCLLALFVAYQMSITMFSHVHYINGVMIVHSHPSDNNQHDHTETQVITLAQAASFIGVEPAQTWIEPVILPVFNIIETDRDIDFVSSLHTSKSQLRAPPAVFYHFKDV